jgi:hypothetical protein
MVLLPVEVSPVDVFQKHLVMHEITERSQHTIDPFDLAEKVLEWPAQELPPAMEPCPVCGVTSEHWHKPEILPAHLVCWGCKSADIERRAEFSFGCKRCHRGWVLETKHWRPVPLGGGYPIMAYNTDISGSLLFIPDAVSTEPLHVDPDMPALDDSEYFNDHLRLQDSK